jgi:hypothetical protein
MYTVIIPTVTMEGKTIKGRPRNRWRDDGEEDLNITGIKKREAMV